MPTLRGRVGKLYIQIKQEYVGRDVVRKNCLGANRFVTIISGLLLRVEFREEKLTLILLEHPSPLVGC
jgi:hypothetical protein